MSLHRKYFWNAIVPGMGVLVLSFFVVVPLTISILIRQSESLSPDMLKYLALTDRILSWSMLGFATFWVFFVGGAFASFLNVVAGRVPHGCSILGSSHCPHCGLRLGFRDNVPFFGWIRNAGRCSTCGEPISIRYLFVEILLGSIFLYVVCLELMTGGWTLPVRQPDRMMSFNRMFFEAEYGLILIVSFHLIMVMSLYLNALIEFERLPIPRSIFAVPALIGLVLALLFPHVILLDWRFPVMEMNWPGSRVSIGATTIIGMMTGAAASFVLSRGLPSATKIGLGLMTVGLFLGWQSVIAIALMCWATTVAIQPLRNRPHATLLATTLVYLAIWQWIWCAIG